jgi:hypothetical protein
MKISKVTKHMKKVAIKRVKRNKKKTTTSEKVLAGIGLGAGLLGSGSGVAPKTNQTQIVSRQNQQQAKDGIKNTLKNIFKTAYDSTIGISEAKADIGVDTGNYYADNNCTVGPSYNQSGAGLLNSNGFAVGSVQGSTGGPNYSAFLDQQIAAAQNSGSVNSDINRTVTASTPSLGEQTSPPVVNIEGGSEGEEIGLSPGIPIISEDNSINNSDESYTNDPGNTDPGSKIDDTQNQGSKGVVTDIGPAVAGELDDSGNSVNLPGNQGAQGQQNNGLSSLIYDGSTSNQSDENPNGTYVNPADDVNNSALPSTVLGSGQTNDIPDNWSSQEQEQDLSKLSGPAVGPSVDNSGAQQSQNNYFEKLYNIPEASVSNAINNGDGTYTIGNQVYTLNENDASYHYVSDVAANDLGKVNITWNGNEGTDKDGNQYINNNGSIQIVNQTTTSVDVNEKIDPNSKVVNINVNGQQVPVVISMVNGQPRIIDASGQDITAQISNANYIVGQGLQGKDLPNVFLNDNANVLTTAPLDTILNINGSQTNVTISIEDGKPKIVDASGQDITAQIKNSQYIVDQAMAGNSLPDADLSSGISSSDSSASQVVPEILTENQKIQDYAKNNSLIITDNGNGTFTVTDEHDSSKIVSRGEVLSVVTIINTGVTLDEFQSDSLPNNTQLQQADGVKGVYFNDDAIFGALNEDGEFIPFVKMSDLEGSSDPSVQNNNNVQVDKSNFNETYPLAEKAAKGPLDDGASQAPKTVVQEDIAGSKGLSFKTDNSTNLPEDTEGVSASDLAKLSGNTNSNALNANVKDSLDKYNKQGQDISANATVITPGETTVTYYTPPTLTENVNTLAAADLSSFTILPAQTNQDKLDAVKNLVKTSQGELSKNFDYNSVESKNTATLNFIPVDIGSGKTITTTDGTHYKDSSGTNFLYAGKDDLRIQDKNTGQYNLYMDPGLVSGKVMEKIVNAGNIVTGAETKAAKAVSGLLDKGLSKVGLGTKDADTQAGKVDSETGKVTLKDGTVLTKVTSDSNSLLQDKDGNIYAQSKNGYTVSGLNISDINTSQSSPSNQKLPNGQKLEEVSNSVYKNPNTGDIFYLDTNGKLQTTGIKIGVDGNMLSSTILQNDNLDITKSTKSLFESGAKGAVAGAMGGALGASVGAVFSAGKAGFANEANEAINWANMNSSTPGQLTIGKYSNGNPITVDKGLILSAITDAGSSPKDQKAAITTLLNEIKNSPH